MRFIQVLVRLLAHIERNLPNALPTIFIKKSFLKSKCWKNCPQFRKLLRLPIH